MSGHGDSNCTTSNGSSGTTAKASSRKTYDTDSIVLRQMYAYTPATNIPISTNYILSADLKGSLSFKSPLTVLGTVGFSTIPAQVSTLDGLLFSTVYSFIPWYYSTPNSFLPSTVAGLTESGYLNVYALTSSIGGLGTIGFISSAQIQTVLASSITGLGTVNYTSSTQLYSTVEGLGSATYLSSPQLLSSLTGVGSLGYLSSTQLLSAITNLGSLKYLSSTQLLSSLTGLGSINYVSTLSLTSTVYAIQQSTLNSFVSTVKGLGTVGYISSSELTSSLVGLGSMFYVSSSQLASSFIGAGTLGYLSSTQLYSSFTQFTTLRSSFSNIATTPNWCNTNFLLCNLAVGSRIKTIEFNLGNLFRNKISRSSKIDIEVSPNLQFSYYDNNSGQYQFNTFLVLGSNFNTANIIGQESMNYYILNQNQINLSFFFQQKNRFLISDPTVISNIKYASATLNSNYLSLWHTFGPAVPLTNQFFASPTSTNCVSVVLDNLPNPSEAKPSLSFSGIYN